MSKRALSAPSKTPTMRSRVKCARLTSENREMKSKAS
jgi:hypothetical protein